MGIWSVTLNQLILGQEIRNVWHYTGQAEQLSSADTVDLADFIRAVYASVGPTNFSNDWRLYSITVRKVDEPGWPSVEVPFTDGPFVGTSAGENLPTQCCLLVHGSTYTLKPNRTRTYHGALLEGHLADGYWNSTAQSQRLTLDAGTDEINLPDAGDIFRCAVKYDRTLDYVTDANVITSFTVSVVPAVQRRRRIGRGS